MILKSTLTTAVATAVAATFSFGGIAAAAEIKLAAHHSTPGLLVDFSVWRGDKRLYRTWDPKTKRYLPQTEQGYYVDQKVPRRVSLEKVTKVCVVILGDTPLYGYGGCLEGDGLQPNSQGYIVLKIEKQ